MSAALQTVNFHGTDHALLDINGTAFVAMRPVVEAIGLDWEGQRQRIMRDEVLGTSAFMTKAQLPDDSQVRELVCLPLDMLNGWLFGVSVKRVREELRETLIAYKRECYAVLHRYWQSAHTAEAGKSPGWARRGEADNVVDAGRCFNAYLRVGKAMGLKDGTAARRANDAAYQRTGVDLAADIGFADDDVQALADPTGLESHHLYETVRQYVEGKAMVNATQVASAVLKTPAPPPNDVAWVGKIMRHLGFTKLHRAPKGQSGRFYSRGFVVN